MHLVQCKNKDCTAVAVITEHDVDVHSALDAAGCACCPQDHHHGQAANAGAPCRPVTITLVPGSADVTPVSA
jgi:hypothetical protein